MEVSTLRIVLVLHTENQMKKQYAKKWGYLLAPTQYKGVFEVQGYLLARGRRVSQASAMHRQSHERQGNRQVA